MPVVRLVLQRSSHRRCQPLKEGGYGLFAGGTAEPRGAAPETFGVGVLASFDGKQASALRGYSDAAGARQVATDSTGPGRPHPEELIWRRLAAEGVDPGHVRRVHRELEPCLMPGHDCGAWMQDFFRRPSSRTVSVTGRRRIHARQGSRTSSRTLLSRRRGAECDGSVRLPAVSRPRLPCWGGLREPLLQRSCQWCRWTRSARRTGH